MREVLYTYNMDMCTGPGRFARAKLMAAAPSRARGTYLRTRPHETTVAKYRSDTERIKTPRGPPLLLMAFACILHTYNVCCVSPAVIWAPVGYWSS